MKKLEIIHETKDYLIINKPSGLIVENNPFESPTVESLVTEHLLKEKRKPYVGIVHRLDRVTSGIMVFAKKKSILRLLNESFQAKKVQKTYYAVVTGNLPAASGTLKHFLRKNQKEKRAEIFNDKKKDAKECILHFKALNHSKDFHLLEIIPESGKFHQIRAQLAFMGCPIVGDDKYGSSESYKRLSVCLHAGKLCFPHPVENKKQVCFEAAFPNEAIWNSFQL